MKPRFRSRAWACVSKDTGRPLIEPLFMRPAHALCIFETRVEARDAKRPDEKVIRLKITTG